MKKINEDRLQEIINYRRDKKTIPEISKLMNLGKGTIGYYLTIAYERGINDIKNVRIIHDLSKEFIEQRQIKIKKTWNYKLINEEFNTLSFERIRKRVKLEQEGKCNRCGIKEWLGIELSLELEHKDGNRNNNLRENLEALCPNCHSLTSTWRGRNKLSKRNKISDELFRKELIKNEFNIRQTLIKLELTPKGGNYKRAHRLISEIKSYNNLK